ncbi:serine protease [Parasediminibacterium sp. JCM 36343]|uniref:S1 family peptidase n=1 Tax=Parasediminibacterium sp. JCM 36343 TaxID=3374279 RepID=UPI003978A992
MFESSIENVLQYTRPLHTISRTYGGLILPGSSTFFFVNDNGIAITCKHVLDLIPGAERVNDAYNQFKQERDRLPKDNNYRRNIMGLEKKYKYNSDTTVQLKNNFLNCFDKIDAIVCHPHPTLDLAILEFKGFNKIFYNSHAVFSNSTMPIRPGKSLCRVGYPFPEFNNFGHNQFTDDIEWTNTGNANSPSFPIDGIVTRFIGNPQGEITGIEMSTPGLRGQSGGPLFDVNGHVYGMQSATTHLHLGFDLKDKEIINDGKKSKVSNYPFLHVGVCVHVEKIKAFLKEHGVDYTEAI